MSGDINPLASERFSLKKKKKKMKKEKLGLALTENKKQNRDKSDWYKKIKRARYCLADRRIGNKLIRDAEKNNES